MRSTGPSPLATSPLKASKEDSPTRATTKSAPSVILDPTYHRHRPSLAFVPASCIRIGYIMNATPATETAMTNRHSAAAKILGSLAARPPEMPGPPISEPLTTLDMTPATVATM
jgi:hypothetical protein